MHSRRYDHSKGVPRLTLSWTPTWLVQHIYFAEGQTENLTQSLTASACHSGTTQCCGQAPPRPLQASETSLQSTQLPLLAAPGLKLAPQFSTQCPAGLVLGSLSTSSPPGPGGPRWTREIHRCSGWWEVQSECFSVGSSINHADPPDSLECKAKC